MHQIAKLAGVSLGTVSHVINETASVREPLRQRVMEAVEKLGYQPNQLSRGLRLNRTNMIGMIIPDITNPFFPELCAAWKMLRTRVRTGWCCAIQITIRQGSNLSQRFEIVLACRTSDYSFG